MVRPRVLVLSGALAALTGLSACTSDRPDTGAQSSSARPNGVSRPADGVSHQPAVAYKGLLPPLPVSPYAGAPPDVVRAVYEFAARRPDVLRFVPCFCGCERNGHQDNEDCFVAGRDPDGRPHWDAHGLG